LGGPPCQIIAGRLMPSQADHHDAVQGRVGLAVATSVQAVPHGFPEDASIGETPHNIEKAASL
jgi:hypothetical protein